LFFYVKLSKVRGEIIWAVVSRFAQFIGDYGFLKALWNYRHVWDRKPTMKPSDWSNDNKLIIHELNIEIEISRKIQMILSIGLNGKYKKLWV